LAGKVGSNIATELGTMRISEQIDALDVMGINSRGYLIRPKVIAALIVVPMLIVIGVFLGCYGGLLACSISGFMTPAEYERGLHEFFEPYNVYIMLIKSLVFAFIMTTVSCFHGYHAEGGALEIGKASTSAVVQSCIFIIISDYLLATILL
jgi:phospholipid/cholesterol/gamma-HCH transport system permease protein